MEDKEQKGDELKESVNDKVNRLLRDWMIDIVIIIMLVAYILRSLVTIELAKKDILPMLGDCALMLVFFTTIKQLMARKGIQVGEKSTRYIYVKSRYEKHLQIVLPRSQYIGDFVDIYNERNKKDELSKVLAKYGMNYEMYKSGVQNLTDYQRKGLKEADKAKYLHIRVEDLTGTGLSNKKKEKSLGATINEFLSARSITNISLTILSITIFAVFSFKLVKEFSWANLIWIFVQIAVFLTKGVFSFISAYMFMTEDYCNRIIRQTNLLIEFDSTNDDVFEEHRCKKEKIEQNKEQVQQENLNEKEIINNELQ